MKKCRKCRAFLHESLFYAGRRICKKCFGRSKSGGDFNQSGDPQGYWAARASDAEVIEKLDWHLGCWIRRREQIRVYGRKRNAESNTWLHDEKALATLNKHLLGWLALRGTYRDWQHKDWWLNFEDEILHRLNEYLLMGIRRRFVEARRSLVKGAYYKRTLHRHYIASRVREGLQKQGFKIAARDIPVRLIEASRAHLAVKRLITQKKGITRGNQTQSENQNARRHQG